MAITPLRTRLTATAYALAKHWCENQVLGDQPALEHAQAVADTLLAYKPNAPDALIAAALVHDAPDFADVDDLDGYLTRWLGPDVTLIVRALQQLHDLASEPPELDEGLALVATADKIVSLQAVITRAEAANDLEAHWQRHRGFIEALHGFHAFHRDATSHIPPRMATDLHTLITRAEELTRRNPPPDSC